MRASFAFRVRLFAIAIVLVSLFFIIRLYDIQIVKGHIYKERAESQYLNESIDHFDRGTIFFNPVKGPPIAGATLSSGYRIAVVPKEITNAEEMYTILSGYIQLDREEFIARATKIDDPYEEIAHRVPSEVAQRIREAKLPGIRLAREKWRDYPAGESAANVLGFIGYGNGDTLSGQYGLERFYDSVLTKDNTGAVLNFFADLFADIKGRLSDSAQRPGADILTAIEPTVQSFSEDLLRRYVEDWSPQEVAMVIVEPDTGRVITMAVLPTFNPGEIATSDPSTFANPLVENVYEFGSIVKALTMASGIDSGAVTPETEYVDKGFAVYDGSRISNFDGRARGRVSMQEVLSQSLNTGVAFVVEEMGTDTFREYIEKFGLREETGVDLPNEAQPITGNMDSPRTIEYVTASFGQGIAVTPIAMVRALATLANGGVVPSPHVAIELQYPGSFPKKLGWAPERRALSESATEATTKMLVEVVDSALRGGSVKILEMSVAAKTGTAQIALPNARGYYDDRYLHSFFGYFPAYNPEYLIFMYSVAPQGARYASETLTNPFMETVRFLISYYDIPPDRASYE
ncbi:hypothetical protein COU15_01115 [Candidatus Kaiserbacteria bacterium CG10_big_fil_rev_8_21_14_0_10_45_20]|uniref:Penicillin-binding protein transpeptidase domain-containing protein n=1 Tax=Candidatus Kaiserbacteria bacterium CG10_big_fil_rev_8_21_14_0_10_45_20 TaxID=1974607 RepID=A0A2H0UG83_9BACT|nr:MAG: hypothetical protein COU15_01115 [Candidatus Kaiserbacteria bacterium CG10_big_fil_rev_8_21_14_0_10_45_20]